MSTQAQQSEFSLFVQDEYTKAELAVKRLDNLSSEIIEVRRSMTRLVESYGTNPDKKALERLIARERDALIDFNESLKTLLESCGNLMLSATEMYDAYVIMSNAIIEIAKRTNGEE